jgi:molybdopterin-binding protein
MEHLRMGQAAALVGVSVDTVRRWADAGRLRTKRTRGGQRLIAGSDLAKLIASQASAAPAVGVPRQSARNRFVGLVTRVLKDRVTAQVEIQAGPHRLVALTTREAVDELALVPGVVAVAAVKATSVIVELPL